jgi:hypothetical protein
MAEKRKGRVVQSRYLTELKASKPTNANNTANDMTSNTTSNAFDKQVKRQTKDPQALKPSRPTLTISQRENIRRSVTPPLKPTIKPTSTTTSTTTIIGSTSNTINATRNTDKQNDIDTLKSSILQYKYLSAISTRAFNTRKASAHRIISDMSTSIQSRKQHTTQELTDFELKKAKRQALYDIEQQIEVLEPILLNWRTATETYNQIYESLKSVNMYMDVSGLFISSEGTLDILG